MPDKRIPVAAIERVWLDARLTAKEAAACVGLSRVNLQLRAKALGLPPRAKGRRRVIVDRALFARMWAAGVSLREMAAHFGCHPLSVSQRARDDGLPMRRAGGGQVGLTVAAYFAAEAEARLLRGMAGAARAEQAALVLCEMVDMGRGGLRPGAGRRHAA
jgi:hypothetical protein